MKETSFRLPLLGIRIRRAKPEDSLPFRIAVAIPVFLAILALLREEFWPSWGWAILAFSALGFWMSWIRRGKPNWGVRAVLAVLMIWAGVEGIYGIWRTPYDVRLPLANLLMQLLVLHTFDMPSRKDLNYALLISFILMALAAVFSRDMVFGLSFLLYAVFSVFAFVFSGIREAEGAARQVSSWPPEPLSFIFLRVSVPLLSATLLGSLIFFLFFPRPQGFSLKIFPASLRLPEFHFFHGNVANPGFFMRGGGGNLSPLFGMNFGVSDPDVYFGFNSILDLRYRGRLSNVVVMRVKTQLPEYWRGLAFDTYDGKQWKTAEETPEPVHLLDNTVTLAYPVSQFYPKHRTMIQTFTVEHRLPNLIYAAYQPATLYFPSDLLYRDAADGLRIPFFLEPGTVYTVISEVPVNVDSLLRSSPEVSLRDIESRDLQLPPDLPVRVSRLAREITAGALTPYQKLLALLRYLHSLPYSQEIPPPPPGKDAVDHFLFVLKKGYCEQFASAFAVLARSLGIPARLVTGYATGTYNLFTMSYEVHANQAHAWDEVYFSGIGWIPFDPSPPYPEIPLSFQTSSWAGLPNLFLYLHSVISQNFPRFLFPAWRVISAGEIIFLVAFFLSGIAILFRYGNRHGKISIMERRKLRKKIGEVYRKLEKFLARLGPKRLPSETPLEFLSKFEKELILGQAREIVWLYMKGCFSLEELTREQVEQMERLLREIFEIQKQRANVPKV